VEGGALAQLAAVVGVHAGLATAVQAQGEADCAASLFTGLADEVDDAAGRVAGQGAGRATADDFQVAQVVVGAQELVGRAEGDVAEQQDRQAVFLEP
jgi:hypothetical protein